MAINESNKILSSSSETVIEKSLTETELLNKQTFSKKKVKPVSSTKKVVKEKKKKDQSKKKDNKKEIDLEKAADELIEKMTKYYNADLDQIEGNVNKEINKGGENRIIYKIKHIDEIVEQALNKEFQEILISKGILFEIKRWLEPLPDKTLPNIKIKKSLLGLLCTMGTITGEDLKYSDIGKIVHFYSLNVKESKEVRELSKKLVSKWKNILIKEEME